MEAPPSSEETSEESRKAVIVSIKDHDRNGGQMPSLIMESPSTKFETYRSEAEGYGPQSVEAVGSFAQKERGVSINRSLWVDETGRGRTLHSFSEPRAKLEDEEEG